MSDTDNGERLVVICAADIVTRARPPLPLYKSSGPPLKRGENEKRWGNPLSRPIIWLGDQWAVTSYGLEARSGRYPIRADRLDPTVDYHERVDGFLLEEHVGAKTWVDAAEFRVALAIAIDHHIRQPRMARLREKQRGKQA